MSDIDYHRLSDSVEKIDFQKMEKVSRAVLMTALELANGARRPFTNKPVKINRIIRSEIYKNYSGSNNRRHRQYPSARRVPRTAADKTIRFENRQWFDGKSFRRRVSYSVGGNLIV